MRVIQQTELSDLTWLIRYATHCGVSLGGRDEPIQALRVKFTKAAWRVLCRSRKDDFIPILSNRQFSFKHLVEYCQILANKDWLQAPSRTILAFAITESYLYFDRSPKLSDTKDRFTFMRLAQQVDGVTTKELALVRNWHAHLGMALKPDMKWTRLVARAKQWRHREGVRLNHLVDDPWHFFCRPLSWRGYEIIPLDTPLSLFDEAVAMGSCLYALKYLCCQDSQASRFFSLRKQGKRIATFELTLESPRRWFKGWDLSYGKWKLQDCRLAFNKFASTALINDLIAFASMYNTWSNRPARQPQVSQKLPCRFDPFMQEECV